MMSKRNNRGNPYGKVWLVGAGPGHPDYMTMKGLKVLQQADVIVYDALLDGSFQTLFPEQAEKVFVGKRCGRHCTTQAEINRLLIEPALQGKTVVRLKGGDPYLFGRGGEEWLAVTQAGIDVTVVPGVSALTAAGGLAGIPLTHRALVNRVMILECHPDSLDTHPWHDIAKFDGTIVIFMGTRSAQAIARRLILAGADKNLPIALVGNVSLATEDLWRSTLSQVATEGFPVHPPETVGIIYIGPTVNLYQTEIQISETFPISI